MKPETMGKMVDEDLRVPSSPQGLGLRHLMFLVVVAAAGASVLVDCWQLMLVFLIVVLPVGFVATVLSYLFTRRDRQQRTLLAILAIAAAHGVGLASGAHAFAGIARGGARRKARLIATFLQAGRPLPEILNRFPGLLPRNAATLAILGTRQGALSASLREAQAAEDTTDLYRTDLTSRISYLAWFLTAFMAVTGFFNYWISPKFQAIFNDFGMDLPDFSRAALHYGAPAILGLSLPILLLLGLVLIYQAAWNLGLISLRPPGSGWLYRRIDAASVLRGLAVTIDAGRPLTEGLSVLRDHHGMGGIRRRLYRALKRVEQGEPWTNALHSVGLVGGNDAALLNSAERAGNLAWALRATAEGYERRHVYRMAMALQIMTPLVILAIGVVVGVIVVGYFLPLVLMVQRLAA